MIARASIGPENEEKEDTHFLHFIKSIVGNDTYSQLLHTENSEGLRPLELAAHLGTFWIFASLFETPDIYMTEIDYDMYRVQYFDITEYIIGRRVNKSPVKAMLHLEETKLTLKSTQTVFLQDPIRCWFDAVLYANIPFILLWFLLRLLMVVSSILIGAQGFYVYVCPHATINTTESCYEWRNFKNYIPGYIVPTSIILFVFPISLLDDIVNCIWYTCCSPAWLYRNVSGRKITSVRYKFYVIIHFVCVCVYTIQTILAEFLRYTFDITYVVLAFGFVWSFLFFLQLLPIIGKYVVATQRMISVFAEFSLLFGVFYLSYAFALHDLLPLAYGADFADIRLAMYNTFLVMQNMFSFKTNREYSSATILQLMHITFVLMVPILSLNFLIALLASAYTYVNENLQVLMTIQRLSVAMAVEERLARCLAPIRNHLRRKYLVYEDGHVYVTRTIWPPRNKPHNPRWHGNSFRVTGHLCREVTGHRWIPCTKASDAELWCFLWSAPE